MYRREFQLVQSESSLNQNESRIAVEHFQPFHEEWSLQALNRIQRHLRV